METNDLKSLYEKAIQLDEITDFQLETFDSQEKLDHFAEVITVQEKIDKNSIYKTGEMLTKAKKVCQETHKGFKEWIEIDNKDVFDFSYELAVNFMHVYTCCFGRPEIVQRIPRTILYQVCSPSFPEVIRKSLFNSGLLEGISGHKYKDLIVKIDKQGLEAIEKEVEQISTDQLIIRQVRNSMEIAKDYKNKLKFARHEISRRGSESNKGIQEFKKQIESDQPVAYEINFNIDEAFEASIFTIDTVIKESEQKLGTINEI